MKNQKEELFHYTSEVRLSQILKSGHIKLATAMVPIHDRPAVWLSTNPDWEPTATKPSSFHEKPCLEKYQKVFGLAQNRLGQSVLDPSQFLAQYMQSLAPQFSQQAESINRRLGLDSGVAQGELARGQQSTLSGILADLTRFNAQATANQDLGLLNLMTRSAGARI